MEPVLHFQHASAQEKEFVRRQLGTTQQDVDAAIKVLRDWLDKQPHLPKDIDDVRLESMYINCKCSMERLKTSVEAYFSFKRKFPELLMDRDPVSLIGRCKKFITMFPMPRLTHDCCRVVVATNISADPEQYDALVMCKSILMWSELMLLEDYSLGDIMIIDLKNVVAGHVLRTSPSLVRNWELIYRGAYCRRIKAVHLVNAPRVIDMVLTVAKTALSEKVKNRIMTHLPDSETLFDHVDKMYLPDELGGTGGPAEELGEAHRELFWPRRQWFLDQDQLTADESRRPAGATNIDDLFGVEGSFKKLAID